MAKTELNFYIVVRGEITERKKILQQGTIVFDAEEAGQLAKAHTNIMGEKYKIYRSTVPYIWEYKEYKEV